MTDDQIVYEIIIPHEGGTYTNDPADAGGPTRWGITIPVLSKHRGRPVTALDIQRLTREEAAAIYKYQFVRPFDALKGPLRINAIDMGVNAGVYRAAVLVQQTIGALVDGKLGPESSRLASTRNWNGLYTGARILFYENLIIAKPHNKKWRNGWRNRALACGDLANVEHKLRRLRVANRESTEPIFGFMGKAA